MAETPASDIAHQRGGNPLHSPSSGVHTAQTITSSTTTTTMNAAPLYNSSNGVESIFNTGWDPHTALSQNVELRGSAMGSHSPTAISTYSVGMLKNRGGSNSSHILQYPLDPSLLEVSPKLSSFGSGSFTSMVGPFGLPEYDQITNASCPDYLPTETGIHNNPREVNEHGAMFHGSLHISNEGGSGSSPDAKRKKRVHENSAAINHSQIQVRREKISQRMKYLQDLVPGCVKITGKALMLDKIINYVQSLQRQVEAGRCYIQGAKEKLV